MLGDKSTVSAKYYISFFGMINYHNNDSEVKIAFIIARREIM